MKNKIYILLALLFASAFYACKEDATLDEANDLEANRLFMPMFRQNDNTGKGDSDPRRCQPTGLYGNDIFVSWYEVEGAAAYRIQMKIKAGAWENPDQILLDTIVMPGTFELTVQDLQYGVNHNFAIKALYTLTGYLNDDPAQGEHPYNSQWYGYGDPGHNADRVEVITMERADVPEVLTKGEWIIEHDKARIAFNLNAADNPTTNTTFETAEDTYLIDRITIAPADDLSLPAFNISLTEQDKKNGYIEVEGLVPNAMYIVNGVNDRIDRYWDRLYNTAMLRMKNDPAHPLEPVTLAHIVDTLPEAVEWQASRIDTILRDFMRDNSMPEGTTFLLEGGKNYYIQGNTEISKGLTLKSADPNKPATILLGLGYSTPGELSTGRGVNFSLGRNAQSGEMGSIDIQSIVFEDIHFNAPYAKNIFEMREIGSSGNGTGNYFINQSSSAMEFFCESFEVRRCSFQRMIRGFIRVQGASRKVIKNLIVDECLFQNIGYYSADGRGYPMFACNENTISAKTNVFQHVEVTNSSFIGGSLDHFFNDPNNRAWPSNVSWDITLKNNTFVNWASMSNGRLFFNMRYNPSNSKYTVKNNLFIFTKRDDDPRGFWSQGMNIQNRNGLVFDIADNWSTNAHLTGSGANAQIFTSNPFSSPTQGAGYSNGTLNVGGLSETMVHVDDLSPTQLMVDPNPLDVGTNSTSPVDPRSPKTFLHNVPDGIYYQNTDAVRNSEIYKRNIGDPRWRKNVTP